MQPIPDPTEPHPVEGFPRVGFLQPLVTHPQISVGRYTYHDDPDGPEHFAGRAVQHLYPDMGDRLVIGQFCAIARGVRFVMNGANHLMGGFSTYPFEIFGGAWAAGFDPAAYAAQSKGDTVIGDDVWIGEEAVILPGVRIGAGAVVAGHAVVAGDVPPYAIVAGNPARVVRHRFDAATIDALLALAWWDWPIERITRHLPAIRGADLAALQAAAQET